MLGFPTIIQEVRGCTILVISSQTLPPYYWRLSDHLLVSGQDGRRSGAFSVYDSAKENLRGRGGEKTASELQQVGHVARPQGWHHSS